LNAFYSFIYLLSATTFLFISLRYKSITVRQLSTSKCTVKVNNNNRFVHFFQRLSITIQRFNAALFHQSFTQQSARRSEPLVIFNPGHIL